MATILSLVLASFAICNGVYLAASYLSDRDSYTRFKVTSANDDHVILKAWNTGRRPSTLVAYRVICDEWPAKEVTLDLSDKDKLEAMNVIAPGNPVKIRRRVPTRSSNGGLLPQTVQPVGGLAFVLNDAAPAA